MSNENTERNVRSQATPQVNIVPLDLQYLELIETVLACEKSARQLDRIDAAIKYGRSYLK